MQYFVFIILYIISETLTIFYIWDYFVKRIDSLRYCQFFFSYVEMGLPELTSTKLQINKLSCALPQKSRERVGRKVLNSRDRRAFSYKRVINKAFKCPSTKKYRYKCGKSSEKAEIIYVKNSECMAFPSTKSLQKVV